MGSVVQFGVHALVAIFVIMDPLGAFRIAGGILLFSIAMNMLYAQRSGARITSAEEQRESGKEDVSIIPLAIPLLSGPGAITTVVVLKKQSRGIFEDLTIVLSIVIVCLISYFIFKRAEAVINRLGETGLRVFARLMGLILAVIAVQFVINGIRDVLPQILGK